MSGRVMLRVVNFIKISIEQKLSLNSGEVILVNFIKQLIETILIWSSGGINLQRDKFFRDLLENIVNLEI